MRHAPVTLLMAVMTWLIFTPSLAAQRTVKGPRLVAPATRTGCVINYFGLMRNSRHPDPPKPGTLITLEYEVEVHNYARCSLEIRGVGDVPSAKRVLSAGHYVLKGANRVRIERTTTYTLDVTAHSESVHASPTSFRRDCTVTVELDAPLMTAQATLVRPDVATAWGGYVPSALHTTVYRVRWDEKGPSWASAEGFGFWGDVYYARRNKMYITEFWGPRGTGMFRNQVGHDQTFYIANQPKPRDIKNVFLFFAGQAGMGRPSVTTGQGEADAFTGRGHESRLDGVRAASWAGQLILHHKRYAELYNPGNSLLAMGVQTQYDIATSDDELRAIANGYFSYLVDRTDNFRNVRTVWFGGNSRGGALAIRLAKKLKSAIVAGSTQVPADMNIIVTTSDAVSARNDHLEDRGTVRIWNDRSDADKHDFEALFPGGEWVKNLHIRLCVGASKGVDSMVHGGHTEYQDGLRGNFFSQVFDDRSHEHMCAEWHAKNGQDVVEFFFKKAFGAKDYTPAGF